MYSIALKMLIGDRARYIMLVSALAFAALLMTQQIGVFIGLMYWTTAVIRNTDVPIWVMDAKVEQVNDPSPLRDIDLSRVRSVSGVAWAVPFYVAMQQARLADGRYKDVLLIGLDSATLIGAPSVILEGRLEDLRQAHGVILDDVGLDQLNQAGKSILHQTFPPLKLGSYFEINDHEARIVGICKAERSFYGHPYVFTTYERALEFAPKVRRNLSFILVKPASNVSPAELAERIKKETGLKAILERDFFWDTIIWFWDNTGIPMSFGTTILLGFIVGVAVSGQTFYTFILENMGNLGALKAMGASNKLLRRMLLLQALTAGFIGYGIGVGLTSIFGFSSFLSEGEVPFYLSYEVLLVTLALILIICIAAALIGIRKISKLDAAEVFRG